MNATLATEIPVSHLYGIYVEYKLSTSDAYEITLPTSVPSGYARQAQLEASLKCGFKAYDAQVAR